MNVGYVVAAEKDELILRKVNLRAKEVEGPYVLLIYS